MDAGATMEALSNRDAMRRMGEKLLELADEDDSSQPPERLAASDLGMNYCVQVGPENSR